MTKNKNYIKIIQNDKRENIVQETHARQNLCSICVDNFITLALNALSCQHFQKK